MAFLSQASHLGSVLLPHDAFQEHAAHLAEWPAKLSSKGSERTCIRSGLPTFLHCTFTAHSDLVVAATRGRKVDCLASGIDQTCCSIDSILRRCAGRSR